MGSAIDHPPNDRAVEIGDGLEERTPMNLNQGTGEKGNMVAQQRQTQSMRNEQRTQITQDQGHRNTQEHQRATRATIEQGGSTVPPENQPGINFHGNEDEEHEESATIRKARTEGRKRRRREWRRRTRAKKEQTRRATVRIACQNIRGRGSTVSANDKWTNMNQIIREGKIGITAIQEAHLNQDILDTINTLFSKRMEVFNSQGDNENAQGVAFVINKEIINTANITTNELIPGRAMSITIPWVEEKKLTILNIYAPNKHVDSAKFWNDIQKIYKENENVPHPDLMLGDFNMVEDSIDRIPNRSDSNNTREALGDLKLALNLTDGWREVNEDEKGYTHTVTANGSQARLDRIYATKEIIETASEWVIDDTPAVIRSDHKMIRVDVTHRQMPHMGKGRWTIPGYVLADKDFQKKATERGIHFANELDTTAPRTETGNAQTRFKRFKDDIIQLARQKGRVLVPRMVEQLKKMKEEVKKHTQ